MKKKESKTTSKEHLSKHPLKKRKKATVKKENLQKIQEVDLKPIQEYPPQPSMEIRKKLLKLCGRKSTKRKKAQMKLWDTPVLSLIDGTVSIIFISIMWLLFPYILSNETIMKYTNSNLPYSEISSTEMAAILFHRLCDNLFLPLLFILDNCKNLIEKFVLVLF
ncbi:hypothetical protein TNCT_344791 [Trichonephila clavata]|uniref:Uncharacterized protein n=1 Tax=Trichonephila clavata TaxID=2740835 RepID=A0A8X6FSV1_TRICU|nr:hypothetical protein TNCT_344791 [Trichonephila clavata]